MAPVRVGLVGVAGYGEQYLSTLLDDPRSTEIELVGVADPLGARSRRIDDLNRRGITVHASMKSLLDQSHLDLVLLATPIHLHASQIQLAMERRVNVLCEKPLAATFEQAKNIAAAQSNHAQSFVAVGFQWCFSNAITLLKQDIAAGLFGSPIRLKAIALYPRARSYYARNDWAGRRYTADGEPVFDSPINNATSHFLHAMLYVLGSASNLSATPLDLTAEVYRANPIQTLDCAALRLHTKGGIECLFYTAHCIDRQYGAAFLYEFEHAVVEYSAPGSIVARWADGRTKSYGDPSTDPMRKIFACVNAVQTGEPVACGLEASIPHTLCTSAAYGPNVLVHEIPSERIHNVPLASGLVRAVDGLGEALADCFHRAVLPAEAKDARLAWAIAGHRINLRTPRWAWQQRRKPAPAASTSVSRPYQRSSM